MINFLVKIVIVFKIILNFISDFFKNNLKSCKNIINNYISHKRIIKKYYLK